MVDTWQPSKGVLFFISSIKGGTFLGFRKRVFKEELGF